MTLLDFDILLEEIGEKDYLNSPYLLVSPGLKPLAIDKLLKRSHYQFEDSIIDFYRNINLIDVGWSLQYNMFLGISYSFNVRGRIVVPSLEKLIQNTTPESTFNFLWFEEMEEVEKISMKNLIPFDIGLPEETVCLKKTDRIVQDKLYLCSKYEDELVDMRMKISDYIHRCFETKGIEWWQRALLGLDMEACENIRQILPVIFPNSPFPLNITCK